jgi:4-amino-4-deoxy-L-arabinose transferase-like glycosyltransferase
VRGVLPPRAGPPGSALLTWLADATGLLLAAALVLFNNLGATSLLGDETIYAQVARQAAFKGQWMPTHWLGAIFLAKPPLRTWAVALLFRLFGIDEWTARALDAGMGVATILVVYLAGRALFGRRAGAIAALLLLSAHDLVFLHGLREGVQESALLLAFSAALLAYLTAATGALGPGWTRRRGDVASGLATAASLLVKNAVGLLVLGITGLYELIFARGPAARGWRRLLPRDPLRVLAVLLAVYLPWLALAYAVTGGRYLSILHRDVVERMTAGLDPHHVRHGVYLQELAADFGPALGLLALAALFAVAAWRAGRRGLPAGRVEAERAAFLALWAGFVLAVLSTSASKLEWYLYPAYPAIALLAGYAADRALAWLGRRHAAAGLAGSALIAVYLAVRVLQAWQAGLAPPPRIDADLVARQITAAGHPSVCLDRKLSMREWNVFYLMPLLTRFAATPAEAATCAVLLTEDPARLAPAPLPPGRVYHFHKFDGTEQDIYVVDLGDRLRLDQLHGRR